MAVTHWECGEATQTTACVVVRCDSTESVTIVAAGQTKTANCNTAVKDGNARVDFAGLQAGGIMDWDYYGPVISHTILDGATPPDNALAAAFATGYCTPGGYISGIMLGEYRLGAGRFILNTFNLLDQAGMHPAADRLLLNLVQYAAANCQSPLQPPTAS